MLSFSITRDFVTFMLCTSLLMFVGYFFSVISYLIYFFVLFLLVVNNILFTVRYLTMESESEEQQGSDWSDLRDCSVQLEKENPQAIISSAVLVFGVARRDIN
jgi:hypothetical protein